MTLLQLALSILQSGEAKSLRDIAAREGVDSSYVNRMVNLTTFAPDIIPDFPLAVNHLIFEKFSNGKH
jgi:hypothetical protein